MIEYMKGLGIMERAMAQEEMFDADKIDAKALADVKPPKAAAGKKNGNGKGRKRHPGISGDELPDGMTSIGEAARDVAETAGERLKH